MAKGTVFGEFNETFIEGIFFNRGTLGSYLSNLIFSDR